MRLGKQVRRLRNCLVCATCLAGMGVLDVEAANVATKPAGARVSFTVDEGTWMSVAVAPDGRTLAFDLLGDIYVLDIDGGDARPLLIGSAFETHPVFSPDGSRIAFISDRGGSENLWIANADGSQPRQLSQGTDSVVLAPVWSPDGEYVYVTQSTSYDRLSGRNGSAVWLYHRLGGAGMPVVHADDMAMANMSAPSISADGQSLYFTAKSSDRGAYNIFRRDLDSGRAVLLISDSHAPGAAAMQPVVSPDGRSLAYAVQTEGRTELRLRDLQSGEDRRLVQKIEFAHVHDKNALQGLLPNYAFTPDSSGIVIGYGGKLHRVDLATAESQVIPFKAKVALDVGSRSASVSREATGAVRARAIQSPSLSPDGKAVAFTAFGKLYVASLSNGASKRLTRSELSVGGLSENQPAWSADGRWIVYVSWSRQQGGHLWRVRSDGSGDPQRLTDRAAFYRKPVFTPDGQSLLALHSSAYDQANLEQRGRGPYRNYAQDVVRLPASGGASQKVATLNGSSWGSSFMSDHGRLHFSRDGASVFIHTREGLMTFPLEGGEPRKVVRITAPGLLDKQKVIDDMMLSPDGNWLLLQHNYQLHLIALPGVARGSDFQLAQAPAFRRQLTEIGADHFGWADGGKLITWSVGSTLYRLPLAGALQGGSPVAVKRGADESICADDQVAGVELVAELPRDVPSQDGGGSALVLRGATVATMRGSEIIAGADIVISGNRIVAVGASGTVTIPSGAQLRDVSGKVVTPGFVDTHAHYENIARGVIDYDPWEFPTALAYGVTASIDPQGFTTDMFVYQDLIDAGVISGPRAYTAGPGVFSWSNIKSTRQAKCVIRRYRDHYRTPSIKSYMIGNRQQRQYVVEAAHELGVRAITENYGTPRYALTQVVDGFASNEHASDAIDYYADVTTLYARLGTGYSPTTLIGGAAGLPGVDYFLTRYNPLEDAKLNRFIPRLFLNARVRRATWAPQEEMIFGRLAASAGKIFRAGGNVAVGSHSELQGLGYHWELQALAEGGLTAHEVLQMATRGSATVLGRQSDLGTVEPGKYADLLIFDQDPLQDIKNSLQVKYVLKNGRLYEADTLNEVWPRERAHRSSKR